MNFFKKILGMEDKKEESGEKPVDMSQNAPEERREQKIEQKEEEKKPKNVCEFC